MVSFRQSLLKEKEEKQETGTFGSLLRSRKTETPKYEAKPVEIPERRTVVDRLSDFAKRAEVDYTRSADRVVDVKLGAPQTEEEQSKVESFKRRQEQFEQKEKAKPTTFAEYLARPLTKLSRTVEKTFDTDTGATSAIEGLVGGVARQTPLVGRLAVPQEDLQKLRAEQTLKGEINLPFVGKTEVTPVEVGQVAGALGFTVAQYSEINKILGNLGTTSKLGQILGKSKLAKFGATQATDLLADTIIQTPAEIIDAIEQDKSLDQFGKDFLKNRSIDVLVNLAVGGTGEAFNALKSLRNSGKVEIIDLIDDTVKALPEGQQRTIADQLYGTRKTELDPGALPKAKSIDSDVLPTTKRTFGQQAEPVSLDVPVKPQSATDATKEADRSFAEALRETPRKPDIPTPEVGESKSPILERVKDQLKGDAELSELQRRLNQIDENLPTTSNLARTQAAQRIVDEDLDKAVKLAVQGNQFGSRVESEVARLSLPKLAEQGRYKEYVDVVEAYMKKSRSAGQDVQAATLWSDISPEGAAQWGVQTLKEAGIDVNPDVINTLRKDFEIIQSATKENLTKTIIDKVNPKNSRIKNALLGNLEKNIDSLGFAKLQDINRAIAMEKVTKLVPKLKAKKLSSVQAISHLLNVRTFTRNIVGNVGSIAGEFTSKPGAALADRMMKLYSGNRSAVASASLTKWQQQAQQAWKAGKDNFFEIITSPNNRQINSKYEKIFESAFESKLGKGLEKSLQVSLQTPDEFFKAWVKADSLYSQVQARLGKEVKNWSFEEVLKASDDLEIEKAIQEAEFVTFQNDSLLAQVLSETKTLLNKATKLVPFQKNVFTEDFGLGDFVIKYTRVPGNIITRGFEYSPLGGLKALYNFAEIAAKGAELPRDVQRDLALAMGRGMTGTGLMLMGGYLRKNDIITPTDKDATYNKQAFDKAQGGGSYKINMSALGRLITGQDTKPQEGDTLRSFNFLQPHNVALSVGARMTDEGGMFQTSPTDLLGATWEEAVDLPTLFIVKQMMYEAMDQSNEWYEFLLVPAKEALPGFVPSQARQLAQLIDPTVRETKYGANVPILKQLSGTLGESVTGKIQANIPLLSDKLPPKLDVFGQEQVRDVSPLSLVDPGFKTEFTPKAYNDKIQLVAELSGKQNFFPDRKAPTSVSFQGEKLELSPEEQQRWQKVEGETLDQYFDEFFKDFTEDEIRENAVAIAELLSSVKTKASNAAKQDFFENRGE